MTSKQVEYLMWLFDHSARHYHDTPIGDIFVWLWGTTHDCPAFPKFWHCAFTASDSA